MIRFFNRKTVMITYDRSALETAQDMLRKDKIEYITQGSSMSAEMGYMNTDMSNFDSGMQPNRTIEYKIYVHRKDFNKAKNVLGQ